MTLIRVGRLCKVFAHLENEFVRESHVDISIVVVKERKGQGVKVKESVKSLLGQACPIRLASPLAYSCRERYAY